MFAGGLLYFMPVYCLYTSKLKRAMTDEVVRLGPKYDKVGVTLSYEEVDDYSSESSITYYYLLFKVVQPDDAEAPPVEVVVAGEPPAEVVVAGEVVVQPE